MITTETYKKVMKYAKKLTKSPNDVDDIVQESFELFLRNPVEGLLTNKFYFTLTKRGAFHFYFKRLQKTNRNVLKNQEEVVNESSTFFDSFESKGLNPEEFVMIKDISQQLQNTLVTQGLTTKENLLLTKILRGQGVNYEDRTHYKNLQNKLEYFFK